MPVSINFFTYHRPRAAAAVAHSGATRLQHHDAGFPHLSDIIITFLRCVSPADEAEGNCAAELDVGDGQFNTATFGLSSCLQ